MPMTARKPSAPFKRRAAGCLLVPLLPEIMAQALAATGPAVAQYQIQQPSDSQAQAVANSFGLFQEQFAMQ
jgi:hypothetical protein